MEGSVGISLPQSRINFAAQKHKPSKSTKIVAKSTKKVQEESENIQLSDEDIGYSQSKDTQ